MYGQWRERGREGVENPKRQEGIEGGDGRPCPKCQACARSPRARGTGRTTTDGRGRGHQRRGARGGGARFHPLGGRGGPGARPERAPPRRARPRAGATAARAAGGGRPGARAQRLREVARRGGLQGHPSPPSMRSCYLFLDFLPPPFPSPSASILFPSSTSSPWGKVKLT